MPEQRRLGPIGTPADPQDRIGDQLPQRALVVGEAAGDNGGRMGVYGYSIANTGVYCASDKQYGLYAKGGSLAAWLDGNVEIDGNLQLKGNLQLTSLAAQSPSNEAIHAETQSPGTAAIAAYNLNPEGTGAAVFAKKEGNNGHAGFFDGNVWVSGDLGVGKDITLANADCAEDFDIAEKELVDPGTVMVVGEEGALHQSHQAYDKRVAGVISGAGDYKPGIVLDKQHAQPNRKPLALLGKVYCKVDAQYASIEVGDLLTTSPTPGHAMKATDPLKAFGAVIGKALRPLKEGQGLLPILIALQ